MAPSLSLQYSPPVPPCCCPSPKFSLSAAAAATTTSLFLPQLKRNNPLPLSFSHRQITPRRISVKGTENGSETASEPEATTSTAEQQTPADSGAGGNGEVELSDVGAEIKKMLRERESKEEKGGGGLLSGVAEEIQEIEWPEFGKVLGTTGVVLGVIAGSSVVLLTVNALLAELSDRVFAGKGIQDFFG